MNGDFRIDSEEVQAAKPITVFYIHGWLDGQSEGTLLEAARNAHDNGARYLLIDMSRLDTLTSAGMRAGSGFMSGMPKVRSGWRTGMVNTGWSMKVIQPGDHAYLEFAGVAGRYHAPVWRTVLVGDVSDEVSRRADCNDAAMTLALDMLAPGVTGAQVYDAMAEVFEEYGQREFIHPLFGYSVGIGLLGSWGEPYYLGPSNDAPLQENMVIHHGSYMLSPRHWGMAVSQTILITADGCESLTKTDFKAIRA